MSGILYAIAATLSIIILFLGVAFKKVYQKMVRKEDEINTWKEGYLQLSDNCLCLEKELESDRDRYKMHLESKDQHIANIRMETESEMTAHFVEVLASMNFEIHSLCEEKSKLIRTVNLQAAQLEELEKQPEEAKFFIDGNPLNSDFSGICINGVPLTREQLDFELDSALQAEYPSVWLYGVRDLLRLPSYDHLYEREVAPYKRGLKRGERKLHERKDNTRQSSYRQVAINLRKARKLVELQNYEGGEQ